MPAKITPWNTTDETNLNRLKKALKLLTLVLRSGTLRDRPFDKDARSWVRSAHQLVSIALAIQTDYKSGGE